MHLRPKIIVCWHRDCESREGICLIVLHVLQNGGPFHFLLSNVSGIMSASTSFMILKNYRLFWWSIVCGIP